jgi:ABC-type transporter Mla subunit MlaD
MAVFVAGLLLVLLVIGIGLQLATLEDSRNHIVAQDAKITRLLKGGESAAGAAKPLLRDARPLVRDARRALGPLGDSANDLTTATEGLPSLIRAVAALTDVAVPVLEDARRADIARSIESLDAMIAQIRGEDLIRLSAEAARNAPELIRMQRRLLRVQLRTLETQRASLATQQTTLEIQRQALAAINSIDRKTGGRLPPAGTTAAPAAP